MGHHPALEKCSECRVTHGWNNGFWQRIGLEDIVMEEYVRIGMYVYVIIFIYPAWRLACSHMGVAYGHMGVAYGWHIGMTIGYNMITDIYGGGVHGGGVHGDGGHGGGVHGDGVHGDIAGLHLVSYSHCAETC